MTSCFYNDMFAFDMERKRWYQLGLKVPKIKDNEGKKTKKVKNSELDEVRFLNFYEEKLFFTIFYLNNLECFMTGVCYISNTIKCCMIISI